MRRRRWAWLAPLGGSAAGIVGFGLLYRGIAGGRLAEALLGGALALLGLDVAGRALAASMAVHARERARRPTGRP